MTIDQVHPLYFLIANPTFQMETASFNQTLMTQMFHSDFKQHLKAIESLHAYVGQCETTGVLQANLDLILKWMTLR